MGLPEIKSPRTLKFPPHYKPIRLANSDGDHAELHQQKAELPLAIMGQGDLIAFIPCDLPADPQVQKDKPAERAFNEGFLLGLSVMAFVLGMIGAILIVHGTVVIK
jgi:hypothetical protein